MSNETKLNTDNPPGRKAAPPTAAVVDHTKKGSSNSVSNNNNTKHQPIKAKSTKQEIETVTLPKADFNKLTQELTFWRNKCSQLSVKLDRIGGALIQVQGSVYNAKNSIISQ